MAVAAAERTDAQGEQTGLKANAIGFVDALVIGLASTAPAYSLAAVMGSLAVIVGVQAPAALLASFVPMFFIAAAFKRARDEGVTTDVALVPLRPAVVVPIGQEVANGG
jgi:hypothetical protein